MFSKDEIFLICTKLDLKDLLNFCLCNKSVYSVFRSRIWLHKLKEEYPKFEKCEFETYCQLYRDLGKIDEENEDIYEIYTLSRPKFIENARTLSYNINRLMIINDLFFKREKRTYYIYLIFSWIDKNIWFLETREKFRIVCQQKLRDLINEEKIFEKFSHLLNI